jgi:hypothetical protein
VVNSHTIAPTIGCSQEMVAAYLADAPTVANGQQLVDEEC